MRVFLDTALQHGSHNRFKDTWHFVERYLFLHWPGSFQLVNYCAALDSLDLK